MAEQPRVVAFFLDDVVAEDDPLRVVKLRARQLCNPHYQAGQRAARLTDAVDLFADPAFDPYETGVAAKAAGLSDSDLDAATYVALVLRETELGGLD
jgi:hypothetical protein